MEWFWLILALLLGITAGWLFVGRSRRREGVQGAPATGTSGVTAPPTAGPDPSAVEQPATAVAAPSPAAADATVEPDETAAPEETVEPAVTTSTQAVTDSTPGPAATAEPTVPALTEPETVSTPIEATPAEATPAEATPAEEVATTPEAPVATPAPVEPAATPASAEPIATTDTAEPVATPAPAEPVAAPAPTEPVATTDTAGDDLRRIEGIGPKMAAALQAAGITGFRQLAEASEDDLRQALRAAGVRMTKSLPTWPQQAKILAGDPVAAAVFTAPSAGDAATD